MFEGFERHKIAAGDAIIDLLAGGTGPAVAARFSPEPRRLVRGGADARGGFLANAWRSRRPARRPCARFSWGERSVLEQYPRGSIRWVDRLGSALVLIFCKFSHRLRLFM